MKSAVLAVVASVCLVGAWAHAFTNVRPQAGVNIGSTSGSGAPSSTKFMAGVGTQFALGSGVYAQPELNYMGQGPGVDYLILPLMLSYRFDTGSAFRPFVGVGPELGLKMSGTNTKAINLAIDFQGGIEYHLLADYFLVGLGRYSLGMTNISDFPGADVKTRNFHILGGVGINL